jgi:hypothetical protein
MVSALLAALALLQTGVAQRASADTGQRHAVQLESVNESDQRAFARLTGFGDQTVISVTMEEESEATYLPHLHEGTCTDYDGIPILPLAESTPGQRSRAVVDIPLEELLAGNYLIDVHPATTEADSLFDPDSAVVCGELSEAERIDQAAGATERYQSTEATSTVMSLGSLNVSEAGRLAPRMAAALVLAALAVALVLDQRWARPAFAVVEPRRQKELRP